MTIILVMNKLCDFCTLCIISFSFILHLYNMPAFLPCMYVGGLAAPDQMVKAYPLKGIPSTSMEPSELPIDLLLLMFCVCSSSHPWALEHQYPPSTLSSSYPSVSSASGCIHCSYVFHFPDSIWLYNIFSYRLSSLSSASWMPSRPLNR